MERNSILIAEFNQEMVNLYQNARRRCRYRAGRFFGMLTEHGGLRTAQILLSNPEISSGFGELWLRGAQDLTVEALVVQPRWRPLFSEEELARAESRLQPSTRRAA